MDRYEPSEPINIGVGEDINIAELAGLVKHVVGYDGEVVYDTSKPDGTPGKLLDVSRLRRLGWEPQISLREGIAQTYDWYCATLAAAGT